MRAFLFSTICFFFLFNPVYSQNGKNLYTMYCAGCHGANLEGTGSASKLYRPIWKHGSERDDIINTIANGVPSTTMIPWQGALTKAEIESLADYILEVQKLPPREVTNTATEYISTSDYKLKVEKVVTENLGIPWGIEFLNLDSALVSEKSGQLKWLVKGRLDESTIKGLPVTHLKSSTGGYMDITLDPNYSQNGWIYLAYSHTNGDPLDENAKALTKIIRGRITDHYWTDQQTLFEVPDSLKVVRGNRWGCRFLFDQQGYLYFTIGDMGKAQDSQRLDKATGKVFRINPDGSIPQDNPYIHDQDALPQIYTIGNRNVQGIAQHPTTGEIWATEHGPRGGDELNILKKGANYGWPVITYGINYNGTIITEKTHQEGMEQPIVEWTPSIAVCPAEFCSSPLFSKWKDNLLVGALAFQEIRRLTIQGQKVTDQELLLKGMGRIRELKFAPDGSLYVLTSGPNQILRLTPVEAPKKAQPL